MSRYVFDPEELQEAANLGQGQPVSRRWDLIYDDLRQRHPDHLPRGYRWTFNTAGNVVCQIALVYGSPLEYVAFFGTPLGATGFSGRYPWADVWDLMVAGTMRTFIPGQFEPTVYRPGDSAYLPRGMGKGVQYEAHTWMIDYARGLPVTMLPFGVLAPWFFVAMDGRAARTQLAEYARLTLANLRGRFAPSTRQ